MNRLKFKIEFLAFDGTNLIVKNETVMNGLLLYINPKNVKWFYVDDQNHSNQKQIKIGSIIECDYNINESTRQLNNVIIIE